MAQESLNRSSHAYDKRLLSRIGRPSSPPRTNLDEASRLGHKLSLKTNYNATSQPHSSDPPSASQGDSAQKWGKPPLSSAASPGSRLDWREYRVDYRSPSVESTARSTFLESDLPSRLRDSQRPITSGSSTGNEEPLSAVSRSHRGSYDQAFFSDDLDFASDETNGVRRLDLSDPAAPRFDHQVFGMKRRAPSPSSEEGPEDKLQIHTSDNYQRLSAGAPRKSPMLHYRPNHGSVSSTTSSAKQSSYVSSAGLSGTGSSLTSMSSFDRYSPNAVTPSDAGHLSPFTSTSLFVSPASSAIPAHGPAFLPEDKLKASVQKLPLELSPSDLRPSLSNHIGGHFMCECCPKKPKKFETQEALR